MALEVLEFLARLARLQPGQPQSLRRRGILLLLRAELISSRWNARPEGRWALWAGIAGALAGAALSVKAILGSAGTAAILGFVLVPFIAAIVAIPVGIWGAALGHVVLRLRGAVDEPWIVFWVALVAAAALPATVVYELWRRLALP